MPYVNNIAMGTQRTMSIIYPNNDYISDYIMDATLDLIAGVYELSHISFLQHSMA